MNYDGWTEEGIDAARLGRLGVGYVVGAALLGGLVAWATLAAADESEVSAEEAIEVSLADFPEEEEEVAPEPEPEPEIEPPPPPPPPAQQAPPPEEEMPYEPAPAPAPGEEAPDVPDEVPDEDPNQKEPTSTPDDDPFKKGFGHGGKPGGTGKGPGVGTGTAPAPPPPPPPPPPAPPKARRSLETTEPAIRLSCPRPSPPAAVVGEGGVVMVKLKVDVSGAVVRVKAASGPAALRPFAEQAAMGCRFKPAKDKDTGQPVPFLMVLPFQFTSKT